MTMRLQPGCRVLVPFGRNKRYVGLVKRLHDRQPEHVEVKELEAMVGDRPFVTQEQFSFWEWLADYYLCAEGEVMHAALPHSAREVSDTSWRPMTESYIRLTQAFDNEESLKELFDFAEARAPRQLELLLAFIRLSGRYESTQHPVLQKNLTGQVKGGTQVLTALIKKGVFETYIKELSRFPSLPASGQALELNENQQRAWEEVKKGLTSHNVTLLHGVTSSGKTELYVKLIREYLDRGMQVLYLLPEIALTTQIINRLQHHFGNRAGVYHSRFSWMERSEVWNNLLDGGTMIDGEMITYDLVLGPRSALFLPFRKLGLVIIDEEHDPGFKQQDPAPRYHARDAAIYLATMHKAKVLMGSATPSLESYFHAQTGKFAYVELTARYGGVLLPEVLVADLKKEASSGKMKSHFSGLLYRLTKEALENKEQVILFQNRRGFSLMLQCDLCDWRPSCHQCDVTLVYHKKEHKLKCHYCGHATGLPSRCPSCASTAIKMRGFGTEKIEDELPVLFPDAVIARMDLDTTRAKHAYREIIQNFESRKIDILIGTQMVSKGLDFSHVSLVGILNADNMLGFPEFRAHERAFQLMAQVSGRSGRSQKRGKVVIQTLHPKHPVIKHVVGHDYRSFYVTQVTDRRKFHYPPFTRLVLLTVMHRDQIALDKAAEELASRYKRAFPEKVLGPEYPPVARVKNMYMKQILIKLERSQQLRASKKRLMELLESFLERHTYRQLRVVVNVDP